MSSIGGFLGLFPGVSVLQIFLITDNSATVAFRTIVQLFENREILPTPGEAKAKAMPGRLYTHTKINNNK